MSFEALIARANAIRDARDWRQFHDREDAFQRKMDLNEKHYPVDKARGRATKHDKL